MMGTQVMPAVSRETPICDEAIYTRLIAWAVWATDRETVPRRVDELAGDFVITDAVEQRLLDVRRHGFSCEIEAIEKAVAAIRNGRNGDLLFAVFDLYFLRWLSIEAIARKLNDSEFHVTELLRLSMRRIARVLPECERRLATRNGGR